mgnify:FL=1|jgi:hypothetical protein
MLTLLGFVSGALWGAYLARKRGGNPLDILQYAAGFGIAFALLATFTGIALARFLDL